MAPPRRRVKDWLGVTERRKLVNERNGPERSGRVERSGRSPARPAGSRRPRRYGSVGGGFGETGLGAGMGRVDRVPERVAEQGAAEATADRARREPAAELLLLHRVLLDVVGPDTAAAAADGGPEEPTAEGARAPTPVAEPASRHGRNQQQAS